MIGSKPTMPRPPLTTASTELAVSILLSAGAQLLLKRGAGVESDSAFNFAALASGWVWLGIIAMIASLFTWLSALRTVPLGVAFNLTGATHVLIPLGCWGWLGESIPPLRWAGIALVLAGVIISARPAAAVEERL